MIGNLVLWTSILVQEDGLMYHRASCEFVRLSYLVNFGLFERIFRVASV